MRVAISGEKGFTGQYLGPALTASGHEVLGLDADVTDADSVGSELARLRPDAIVHLAALAFVASEDFESFYSVNQVGTFNLLEAARRTVPGARIILPSTAQVYGSSAEGLIGEDSPICPANHYALSKAAMELGSSFWSEHLDIIIVRPFNYTGVGQETRYLVPKIVDHFRRRAPTIELGNLEVRRDFGDVRAVASAYVGLLEASSPRAICNIATGNLESVRGIISRLRAMTGHSISVIVNPAFVRPNDVQALGGDSAHLRQSVPHWRPVDLDDTLKWMMSA